MSKEIPEETNKEALRQQRMLIEIMFKRKKEKDLKEEVLAVQITLSFQI